MKKFLVPTDFSNAAENAFSFAQQLANRQQANLKVLHVFHPGVDPSYPYIVNGAMELMAPKKEQLESFVKQASYSQEGKTATQVKTEEEVAIGFATDEIINQSKEADIDLIVMGTTGGSDFLGKLLGSISSAVAQKAYCPTLLIPKDVSFKGFRNVVYASNHQAADEIMLHQFLEFANVFDSNIHFVHVDEQEGVDYRVREVKFEQIIRDKSPQLGFQMVSIDSTTLTEGLNTYINENNIDLLVMATSHRGFIENIFHKSSTKQMALNTKIPLLVMHYDNSTL